MTHVVVVGDALLDVDLVGRVERLCPDAPVPVVDEVTEHPRPGGAALAAFLAGRDGHRVTLVTALGSDAAARRLCGLLDGVVEVVALRHSGATPVKRRVRVDGHSLVRLDAGGVPGSVGRLTARAQTVLAEADVVLVADYGRGVCAVGSVRDAIADMAVAVPVVWDPHPRGAVPVSGARLVTPNLSETRRFAATLNRAGHRSEPGVWNGAWGGPVGHSDGAGTDLATVTGWANLLVAAWRAAAVAVTMSERGALLSYGRGAPVLLPAPRVRVGDRCGAGDRFAATAAATLGSGAVTEEAVQAAVVAASRFVADGGAAAVGLPGERPAPTGGVTNLEILLARVRAGNGTVVATGGCFDLLHAGHVASLRAARGLGDCLVVCLNSDASVRRLKGDGRPLVRAADRARVLQALEYVDAVVVFDEDTPVGALERIRPDIWAKGGDYAGTDLPEAAVLRRWGGQAVVLPYLPGRSTTRLVRTAQEVGL